MTSSLEIDKPLKNYMYQPICLINFCVTEILSKGQPMTKLGEEWEETSLAGRKSHNRLPKKAYNSKWKQAGNGKQQKVQFT